MSDGKKPEKGGGGAIPPEREGKFLGGVEVFSEKQIQEMVAEYAAQKDALFVEGGVKSLFMADFKNDATFKNFWERGREIFNLNPSRYRHALRKSNGDDFPDEYHIALIVFTLGSDDSSLFEQLNKECRNVCRQEIKMTATGMRTLSLFMMIRIVMEQKASEPLRVDDKVYYYRGFNGELPKNLKVGSRMGFGQFTSTTTEENVKGLLGEDNDKGYMVRILDRSSHVPTKLIRLEGHTEFKGEEEIILSPFQLYTLKGKYEGTDGNILELEIY